METISRHMKVKKVIRNSQHGFTKGKSCFTKLTAFHNEATSSVDEWKTENIVYLDFSNAFEAVYCNILISKLMKRKLSKFSGRLKTVFR